MTFFRRMFHNYAPIIIGVPTLILIHLAWFKLQENDLFVPPDDRVLHPSILEIPTMFKDLKRRYFPPKEKDPEIDSN